MGTVLNINANEWGRNCCLGSIIALYYFFKDKNLRPLMTVLIIGFLGLGFLSGSKNALLIMFFQIGLFLFFYTKKSKRVAVVFVVVLGMIISLYLVMTVPFLYEFLGSRIADMIESLSYVSSITGAAGMDSTSERLYFMITGWHLFLKHPILGIGINNFSAYLSSIGYENAVYSHSGWIEILSTGGIIGFIIYYSMFFRILKSLGKFLKEKRLLVILMFVVVLRILLFDFTTISMYGDNTYILVMLGAVLCNIERKRMNENEAV